MGNKMGTLTGAQEVNTHKHTQTESYLYNDGLTGQNAQVFCGPSCGWRTASLPVPLWEKNPVSRMWLCLFFSFLSSQWKTLLHLCWACVGLWPLHQAASLWPVLNPVNIWWTSVPSPALPSPPARAQKSSSALVTRKHWTWPPPFSICLWLEMNHFGLPPLCILIYSYSPIISLIISSLAVLERHVFLSLLLTEKVMNTGMNHHYPPFSDQNHIITDHYIPYIHHSASLHHEREWNCACLHEIRPPSWTTVHVFTDVLVPLTVMPDVVCMWR